MRSSYFLVLFVLSNACSPGGGMADASEDSSAVTEGGSAEASVDANSMDVVSDTVSPADASVDVASEASPADVVSDVVPRDASANACVSRGGTCVPGFRMSAPTPGFALQCPPGTALYDGRTMFFGPGTDLLSGPVNGGCPQGSGPEGSPAGCCYPQRDGGTDAGSDAASDATPSGPEAACLASGGTVAMSLCCASASDFPNLCLTGPCGCAPSSSHMIRVCQCPSGMCFNGTGCATR